MATKVYGKMEILTPCRSETPKNIETKIGLNDSSSCQILFNYQLWLLDE